MCFLQAQTALLVVAGRAGEGGWQGRERALEAVEEVGSRGSGRQFLAQLPFNLVNGQRFSVKWAEKLGIFVSLAPDITEAALGTHGQTTVDN